jgi:hypothetical protein
MNTCTHTHTHTHRILFCECVSFNEVAAVLEQGGVKLSKKLLGFFLDQQGITHLAVGSVCVAVAVAVAVAGAGAGAGAVCRCLCVCA